jgi:hypothetical protein
MMFGYISTEISILISLLPCKIPELAKYIWQFSSPPDKTKKGTTATTKISPQQIQEACMHPSTIISQTLKMAITLQNTITMANKKLDLISQQRKDIEATIKKLQEEKLKKESKKDKE